MLFHSTSGSSGGGLGAKILEIVREQHSNKIISTISTLPSTENIESNVPSIYNSVLTLAQLLQDSDAVFIFDNKALANFNPDFNIQN